MLNELDLKIATVEPFKVDTLIKLKSFILCNKAIKFGKEKSDPADKEFKETLLIDEVLEAEDNG